MDKIICIDCKKEFGKFGTVLEKRHYKLNIHFKPIRCLECFKRKKIELDIKDKSYKTIKIKYGDECYNHNLIMIRKRDTSSLKSFINKYGEKQGLIKFKEKCDKTKGTLNVFIKRYGEVEGKIKFEIFKNKSKHTKNKYIEQYGEIEGLNKWNNYVKVKKETSIRSIEYWLKKTNNNYEEAKIKLNEYQSQFSKKEYFIEKYGYDDGIKKYNLLVQLKTKGGSNNKNTGYSMVANDLFKTIINIVGNNKYNYYIHPNEKEIIIVDFTFYVDFCIPELDLIIEFYGDYWHCNPEKYKETYYNKLRHKTALEIWEYDTKRINLIKKVYKNILIIKENDLYKDHNSIVQKCVNFIKDCDNEQHK